MFTFAGFHNQIRRKALFIERMEEEDRKGWKVVKNGEAGYKREDGRDNRRKDIGSIILIKKENNIGNPSVGPREGTRDAGKKRERENETTTSSPSPHMSHFQADALCGYEERLKFGEP